MSEHARVEGRAYICPMCPGVRESRPASCPRCGMALERGPALPDDEAERAELAAMESAGVTLVKGDPRAIARARRPSRRTMTHVLQSPFFAVVYNSAGVPVAAGVLYPFLGILLSPIIAAAAMSLSSVSVVTSALRLRRAGV